MTVESQRSADRFTWFLGVACAALAILTLLLAWQNRGLKAQLSAALNATPPGALKIGDTIEAFDVVDAAGNHTRVAFEGHGETLLLVFSSTCGACHQTIPTWNQLLEQPVPSTVQVVGIQTDFQTKSEGALPFPDLRFPVFGPAEPAAPPMTMFPAIPAAAIVDAKGAVKSVWFGVPTDAQVSELRHALAG